MTTAAGDRSLLRNPTFARLWFVQAATQVGGNMALYAMTVLVFSATRSSATVSLLVATYVVPQILLSPFAGVVVDRLDVRWAMFVPNLVRAVFMLGLALTGPSNIPMLLALNLGVSFTSVFLTPAEGSMIPRVVPAAQLQTAMGIFNITLQAAFALGFAFLGPLLVTLSGSPTVLGVVTALYVAATVACIGLPAAPPVERSGRPSRREAVVQPIRELREGFAAVRGDREISRPIIHQAAAASIAGVLGVLGPSLAVMIGLEPDQLAVVVIPLGIGVVVGIVLLRQFGERLPQREAAEAGLFIVAALTVALAVTATLIPMLPVVVALALAAGAAYAVALVSAQTALVQSIPADVRGRVFGVLASVVSTASLVPTLVAGPLADRTSGPTALVITGGIIGVIAIWSNRLFGSVGPVGPVGPDAPVDSGAPRSSSR